MSQALHPYLLQVPACSTDCVHVCHSVLARLRASLQQITSFNTLRAETEKLRAELYSQDNDDHEDMLMKVCVLCVCVRVCVYVCVCVCVARVQPPSLVLQAQALCQMCFSTFSSTCKMLKAPQQEQIFRAKLLTTAVGH